MATPTYMETNDAELVRLVKDGTVWLRKVSDSPVAPAVTVAPDGTVTLTNAATLGGKIGYYSQDGIVIAPQPGDETEFAAHNGDIVITEQAPGYFTVKLSGLENNKVVVETYLDGDLGPDGSIEIASAATSREYDMVIASLDQRDRLAVIHLPRVKINARDDMVLNRTALLSYGMTFRTFKGGVAAPYHIKPWGLAPEAPVAASKPILSAATPASQGEDDIVTITGSHFVGTSAVMFGASAATSFLVLNGNTLVATLPAGSAGAANITVTNVTGTSDPLPYTRTV